MNIVLQPFDDNMKECMDIQIIRDKIVEQEESFSMSLSLGETLSEELMGHIQMNTAPYTVTIQDTSMLFYVLKFAE